MVRAIVLFCIIFSSCSASKRSSSDEHTTYISNDETLSIKVLEISRDSIDKAYSIAGVVSDSATELPLAGTIIGIRKSTKGASADHYGRFKIDGVRHGDTLLATHMWYKVKKIRIDDSIKTKSY